MVGTFITAIKRYLRKGRRNSNDYNARRVLLLTRAAAVVITFSIGLGSFMLSWAALGDLAARAGLILAAGVVWPLIVDGAIVMATLGVVALVPYTDEGRSRRFFWLVLGAWAAVNIGCNALHTVIPAPRR